jgi:hypothetical protein
MPPKTQTFRALYAFQAAESDELDMQAGDIVDVTIVHAGLFPFGASKVYQQINSGI